MPTHGKVAIVTGANSGIGYETAVAFAENGAMVVMACRSLERGQAAREKLLARLPGASVELMQLDLASLASVRRFAEAFKAKHQRLDILANNAGIMMVPYGKTEDSFELPLGTKHLGHFALAMWLKPVFTQSAAMGAPPTLRAAVDPQARGGSYYGPGGFLEYRGFPVAVRSSAASYERAAARKLWEVSEELTGVRYDALDRAVAVESA